MQHGLGRDARALIALGVIIGHALLLLLPSPPLRAVVMRQELQVLLDSAPRVQSLPQSAPAPVIEKKQRITPPSPATPTARSVTAARPVAPVQADIRPAIPALPPVLDAPAMSAPSISFRAASAVAGLANEAMSSGTSAGTSHAASAVGTMVERRKAAWCDTRLHDADYPYAARRDALEGRVQIQARVLSSGKTHDAKVVRSSGFSVLDQAALRASTQWPCTAASLNGVVIDSLIAVSVVFRID